LARKTCFGARYGSTQQSEHQAALYPPGEEVNFMFTRYGVLVAAAAMGALAIAAPVADASAAKYGNHGYGDHGLDMR
jgi:hypothetical protein